MLPLKEDTQKLNLPLYAMKRFLVKLNTLRGFVAITLLCLQTLYTVDVSYY